jgi:hypothetical protein
LVLTKFGRLFGPKPRRGAPITWLPIIYDRYRCAGSTSGVTVMGIGFLDFHTAAEFHFWRFLDFHTAAEFHFWRY